MDTQGLTSSSVAKRHDLPWAQQIAFLRREMHLVTGCSGMKEVNEKEATPSEIWLMIDDN